MSCAMYMALYVIPPGMMLPLSSKVLWIDSVACKPHVKTKSLCCAFVFSSLSIVLCTGLQLI